MKAVFSKEDLLKAMMVHHLTDAMNVLFDLYEMCPYDEDRDRFDELVDLLCQDLKIIFSEKKQERQL